MTAPTRRALLATAWLRRAVRAAHLRAGLLCAGLLGALAAQAAGPAASSAPAAPAALPATIVAALAQAGIGEDGLSLWIAPVGSPTPRLAHRADTLVNPASLMKLVTSGAALDLLGPTYTWRTGVYLDGTLRQGVLHGNLWLRGGGDPRLIQERLWLLLRQVRQLGLTEIRGDLLLDRSAFRVTPIDPGAFDGEPLKPYNVRPDALQLNQKAVLLRLRPDVTQGLAQVSMEPPLAGVSLPASVALAPGAGCNDWRTSLQADFSDSTRIRFAGRYPAGCTEQIWPLAYADPASYDARLLGALWAELGGRLSGKVRDASLPAGLLPAFEFESEPLAVVLRDMNKYSNNVIAEHLFLTLGLTQRGSGSIEAAREVVSGWVRERAGCQDGALRLDNGSGLSREARITAHCLAQVLQQGWASPWMPELVGSLPIAGIEGTAKRAVSASGRAHLKTGSLADVAALAGYVDPPDGPRQVVVAIIHHPQAGQPAARAALDAVLAWLLRSPTTALTPTTSTSAP